MLEQESRAMSKLIVMASDHRGAKLKIELSKRLEASGYTIRDYGTHGADSVDYPVFAAPAARAVSSGDAERGIVICGSGLGVMYTGGPSRSNRSLGDRRNVVGRALRRGSPREEG
jgi:ribose 5-phosphate isomerase B